MEIDALIVTAGPAYFDGAFTDFFVETTVFGSGILAVQVSTTSGAVVDLFESTEDEFICDDVPGEPCEDFVSLAELNALGDLTFTFAGELGESDSIVVPAADWTPGAGQPGFPMILTPPPGDSSLPVGNVFTWATPPSWVNLIVTDLVDLALDEGIDDAMFFNNTTTSWTPSGVIPTDSYEFELSFFDTSFLNDARLSSQGRPFLFSAGFEAFSSKFVPEPSGAAVWCAALASLGVRVRMRSRRTR